MVLTLRRSAYSTNIKTRSDFSCAFFDAELRAVAQGFTQPVHLGSMVEQVPQAVRTLRRRRTSGPGDVIITNDPFPSGVHLNDVSLISPVFADGELLGYVANLAHHVDVGGGAPAIDRRLPRGVPGGRDHPARQGRRGRADRRRRLPADPGPDPLEARDRRRLPRPDRRERDGRAAGSRRSSRATATRRSWPRCRSCSTTPSGAPGPRSRRCRTASTRRRARSTPTATPTSRCGSARGSRSRADGVSFDLAGSDPQRRAPGQLDLRPDVLGLRLRAQVPDRPRPAGQRRLLPARAASTPRGAASRTAPGPRRSSAAGRRRPASSTSSSARSCPRCPRRSRPGRRR